jgi:beta-N-acetylhexosaminidase
MEPASGLADRFVQGLTRRGAKVTVRHIPQPTRSIPDERRLQLAHDVCIYFANLKLPESANHWGIQFSDFKGADAARHAEVRYLLVSVTDPFLARDVPAVQAVINGYTPTVEVVDACVAKLYGESPFRGMDPVGVLSAR